MGNSNHRLPSLGANNQYSSISGFSGGSYMATNLNVIYSETFKGVGLLAGGPYLSSEFLTGAGIGVENIDYVALASDTAAGAIEK